jgi:hypothetical protein
MEIGDKLVAYPTVGLGDIAREAVGWYANGATQHVLVQKKGATTRAARKDFDTRGAAAVQVN